VPKANGIHTVFSTAWTPYFISETTQQISMKFRIGSLTEKLSGECTSNFSEYQFLKQGYFLITWRGIIFSKQILHRGANYRFSI